MLPSQFTSLADLGWLTIWIPSFGNWQVEAVFGLVSFYLFIYTIQLSIMSNSYFFDVIKVFMKSFSHFFTQW